MHIITFSFDDGFHQSSVRTAEIFEKFGLLASFNVVATAHNPGFGPPNAPPWNIRAGDFALWNELRSRGHEVMPHGYCHANKAKLPLAESQDLINRCLDVFDRQLAGFDRKGAIFNFPYNSTTAELEAWLPTVVRAFRGGSADYGINALPSRQTVAIRTTSFGPGDCAAHVEACVAELLGRPEGWLVYNTHGLDGEGWGPIDAASLERLLGRLIELPTVRLLPAGAALKQADAAGC